MTTNDITPIETTDRASTDVFDSACAILANAGIRFTVVGEHRISRCLDHAA